MLRVSGYISCGILSLAISAILILIISYVETINPFSPGALVIAGNYMIIDFFQYWIRLICLLILIISTQASLHDIKCFNYNLLKLLFLVNFYLVIIFIGTQNLFNLFIIFEISIIPIYILYNSNNSLTKRNKLWADYWQ